MPHRDIAPAGAPIWIELFTSDPDRSRAFYGDLFGWESQDMGPEFGNYLTFTKGGVQIAGGMRNDGQSGAPDGWTVYLKADDAGAVVEAAAAHGGQVIVDAMPVMDLGSMAVVESTGHGFVALSSRRNPHRVRPDRRGRRSQLVRAVDPRLRGGDRVLPGRVRLEDRRRLRHRRLPLHDDGRRRRRSRRGRRNDALRAGRRISTTRPTEVRRPVRIR